jgi:hypothetical protein
VIEVFDHRNSPELEPGDVLTVDPTARPLHDDWVFASVGPARSPFVARYVLRGRDADVERRVEQLKAQLKDSIEREANRLLELSTPEEVKRYLLGLADQLKDRFLRRRWMTWRQSPVVGNNGR